MTEAHERIREIRDKSPLSKEDFAQKAGVALASQYNYEKGSRKPSLEYLQNLYAAGVDVMYIITGEKTVPDGFVRISKMSATGSMGMGVPADLSHDDVIDSVILQENWVRLTLVHFSSIENLRIVTGQGDSMSGTFEDGDALFVDIGVTEFQSDAVYMFELYNDIRIKRLQAIKNGRIRAISDNKKYDALTIEPDDDFRVIGRVVGKWAFARF